MDEDVGGCWWLALVLLVLVTLIVLVGSWFWVLIG
jgi:hypothetical protein